MKLDLHNHSIYSDGLDDINTLVIKALDNNMDKIAITDHDTVLGLVNLNKELEKYVIKGIELSTYYKGHLVHILGYFKKNILTENIIEFSKNFILKRQKRAYEMLAKIKDYYKININLDEVYAVKGVYTRGNMIRNILSNNEKLEKKDALNMISEKSPCYIKLSDKLDTIYGIKFLKENNCIVSLAHPTRVEPSILPEVMKLDFDGIECIYPIHTQSETNKFINFCKKNNLLITGGSDTHSDNLSYASIGTSYIKDNYALEFLRRLDK